MNDNLIFFCTLSIPIKMCKKVKCKKSLWNRYVLLTLLLSLSPLSLYSHSTFLFSLHRTLPLSPSLTFPPPSHPLPLSLSLSPTFCLTPSLSLPPSPTVRLTVTNVAVVQSVQLKFISLSISVPSPLVHDFYTFNDDSMTL